MEKTCLVVIVFCVFLVNAQGSSQSTTVNRCVHSGGQPPLITQVHGCTNPPCLVPQLQYLVIDVTFVAPHNITEMSSHLTVSLKISGIQLNVPTDLGESARTCNFLTLPPSCPIQKREIVMYRFKWSIGEFFPVDTLASVELRVVDNDRANAVIWCIRLPIQILPPARGISDASGDSPTPIFVNLY